LSFAHSSKTPKQRQLFPGGGNLRFRRQKKSPFCRRAKLPGGQGTEYRLTAYLRATQATRDFGPSQESRGYHQVPLLRYFVFVGSLLLAMLFMADRYWADASSPSFMREAKFDKSIIRIQSAHKWPARIDFDTSLPTIVPPPMPVLAANVPVAKPPRDAFAQLKQPSELVLKSAAPPKAKRKLVRRTPATRIAAYPAAPETFFSGW
jgi:hypothetical protein